MKRYIAALMTAAALTAAAGASAANPPGTGQPGQNCEQLSGAPAGFSSGGFANAKTHYANIDGTPRVSQYDVACFQLSQ
jgi:hypothetical protein